MGNWGKIIAAIILAFLSSCVSYQEVYKAPYQTTYDDLRLIKKSFYQLPGWQEANLEKGFLSFNKSCEVFLKKDKTGFLKKDSSAFLRNADWQKACLKINYNKNYSSEQIRKYFEENFLPFAVTYGGADKGLFTGYHVSTINGSFVKTDSYRYPIYKKPDSLSGGDMLYTRSQISNGALSGRGLEIMWTDDPVGLFFMHIQGSGVVRLPDGTEQRLGYDGKNNSPYYAIGKYLIERGFIEKSEISAQKIKRWLKENPGQAQGVMEKNESFIFFRLMSTKAAIGAMNVELTPMASLAIDKNYIALGVPLWLDVELTAKGNKKMQSLVVAQDTGSAIKGAIRGDIFFGTGPLAEEMAGYQKGEGSYYVLIPR